ncbi:MAG: hypothetical protein RL705_2046 [Bacteroidota bacterium]|jgi:hypothetical protein
MEIVNKSIVKLFHLQKYRILMFIYTNFSTLPRFRKKKIDFVCSEIVIVSLYLLFEVKKAISN